MHLIAQDKINDLNINIDGLRRKLADKLTAKGVTASADLDLITLIRLIPANILTPVNLYQFLSGHTAINTGNHNIMFCGGMDNGYNANNIQKLYNTANNTFVSKTNYSSNIVEHGGAKWDNIIYYTGGVSNSITNTNYAYDIQSNAFTAKANMPQNRAYHTSVTTDSFLLISGGYHTTDYNTQYTYDIASNSYVARANMRQPSDRFSAAHIIDNKVLINGGNDGHNQYLNYIYDIRSNTITDKVNLTNPRRDHASLKIDNDTMLIVGGIHNSTPQPYTVQSYHIAANSFTNKKAPPETWDNHTLTKVQDTFLISGGYTNKQYMYDYTADKYQGSR